MGVITRAAARLQLPGLSQFVGRRSYRALVLAAVTGVLTGASVAAFEWVVRGRLLDRLVDAPLAIVALAPAMGLALAALALRYLAGGASPATSDAYIENFHQEGRRLDLRPVWGRIVAGGATLGSGGALGFEGPSLYIGAAIGTALQRTWSKHFSRDDAKLLMVAGAAAGVAAIFKAPATGAVFALEVPYRDDTAKRMLLPALLAAATSYLTFVTLVGTEPLFDVAGTPPFDLKELGGAVVLGLLCGLGARLFAAAIGQAKRLAKRGPAPLRVALAGGALAAIAVAGNALFHTDIVLGAGYGTLDWVTEPGHGLALIVALFAFRLAATFATLAGGGVGGLFVPLVIAGAITGDAMSTVLQDNSTLFPLIGVAAFLGAGYRTPLAGVMFVAETTGRPGFIVPGLIASVASQLVMGDVSVSPYQSAGRVGHLEKRFVLATSSAIRSDVAAVPPDADVQEFYEHHLLLHRQTEVPVVDGQRYVGMVSLWDVQALPVEERHHHTVGALASHDWPTATPDQTLERAIATMEQADVDTLPVVADGNFVGVVTTDEILRLDQILHHDDDLTG